MSMYIIQQALPSMYIKIKPLYGIKAINTFAVKGSYITTSCSVFVQASGALDTLPPYINYELLIIFKGVNTADSLCIVYKYIIHIDICDSVISLKPSYGYLTISGPLLKEKYYNV